MPAELASLIHTTSGATQEIALEDSMEIQNFIATFPERGGSGPQTDQTVATFTTNVRSAVAVLTGFKAKFSPRTGDHHLGLLDVTLNITGVAGPTVSVNCEYGLRDWGGNWDDHYEGEVSFAVLAETA